MDCTWPKKEKKVKSEPAAAALQTRIILSSKAMEIVTRIIIIYYFDY